MRALLRTAAVVLLSGASTSTAYAYEDQLGLTGTVGYSGIFGDTSLPPHGVTAGIGVSYGLGDTWELRGRVDYTALLSTAHRGGLTVDVVYLVDVLSFVPYVGLSAGGSVTHVDANGILPSELRFDVALGAVLGFDVVLDRAWTVGVEVRPFVMVLHLADEPFNLAAVFRVQRLIEL